MSERDYKKDYIDLFSANQINLRERIATEMYRRNGIWDEPNADRMVQWIEGNTKKVRVDGPYSPSGMLKAIGVRGKAAKDILAGKNPKTGKRRYTKRSKRWKKTRAKKSA